MNLCKLCNPYRDTLSVPSFAAFSPASSASVIPLFFRMFSVILQKMPFRLVKGALSCCKRCSFALQKVPFCSVPAGVWSCRLYLTFLSFCSDVPGMGVRAAFTAAAAGAEYL